MSRQANILFSLDSVRVPDMCKSRKLTKFWLVTLQEMVADTESELHMKDDTRKMLKADLENVLHTLNPRERDVMRLRYGMEDGRARTLEEVGNLFKVTRERIRQIETKALRKLRQPSRSNVLLEYVEGGMQEGLAVN